MDCRGGNDRSCGRDDEWFPCSRAVRSPGRDLRFIRTRRVSLRVRWRALDFWGRSGSHTTSRWRFRTPQLPPPGFLEPVGPGAAQEIPGLSQRGFDNCSMEVKIDEVRA